MASTHPESVARPARRLAATVALVALGALTGAAALAAAGRPAPKASFELRADRSAYDAGAPVRLAAVVEIDPGWHVNSHEPSFDYLIPTSLELDPPAGWTLGGIDYPPGEMQRFAFETRPLSVYDGRVTILARLRIGDAEAREAVPVSARLTFQACDDRSCLPPETLTRRLDVLLAPGGVPIDDPAFATRPAAPMAQPPASGLPLGWMLLLAALGGLILNAMPCVLPVLSLKLFGLVKSAGEGRRPVVFGSLATGAAGKAATAR